jgi:hypothetical protein
MKAEHNNLEAILIYNSPFETKPIVIKHRFSTFQNLEHRGAARAAAGMSKMHMADKFKRPR